MTDQGVLTTWFGRDSRFGIVARAAMLAVALVLIVLNSLLVANQLSIILAGYPGADFTSYQQASERVFTGGLYVPEGDYVFRYSPVAAYLFVPLRFVDPAIWRVLHVIGAMAMPTWPMRLLLLVSWPFAFDLQLGNLMTFILLAAAWGLRGNGAASLIFLALSLLAPRPLVVPLAVWLLWRQPSLRWPFVTIFTAHAVLVVLSGWGDDWIGRLLTSTDELASRFNIGPSVFVGAWWLVVGIPLGVWLFRRGLVGLSCLAVTPYVLPYYLMLGLLDLPPRPTVPRPAG